MRCSRILFRSILLSGLGSTACSGEQTDDGPALGDSDLETGDSAGPIPAESGLLYGFFAVHLDPGSPPNQAGPEGGPSDARPVAYFDELVSLVEAADLHEHRLTLMFTAQWAAHIVDSDCRVPPHPEVEAGAYVYRSEIHTDCLSLVRAFEFHGHEMAFHHHPESAPNNWDGFSNESDLMKEEGYLGTVDDLSNYVAAIPEGGVTSLTAGTTEEYPEGTHHLRYMSARGPTPYEDAENRGDLVSSPCAWSEDGPNVWRFRMRAMGPTVEEELAAAIVDLAGADIDYTVGFITHAKDLDPTLAPYESLFSRLATEQIRLEGLSTVAGHYDYTVADPVSTGAHGCPEDEAL